MIALPDVNLLLALAWQQHLHHDAAHAWFARSAADGWATCLLTPTAFLRLSMNPQVVHAAIGCRTARELLAGLVAHPGHQFIADSPPLTVDMFDSIEPLITGYRQMTHATLVFVARAHGLKVVSFDQSMRAVCPFPESLEILVA